MINHGEEMQRPTLRELFEAQTNDHACNKTVLANGLPKSVFPFDTKTH